MVRKRIARVAIATAAVVALSSTVAYAQPAENYPSPPPILTAPSVSSGTDRDAGSTVPSATQKTVGGWKLDDQTKKGGETLGVAEGYIHLKAGTQNGNDVKKKDQYPAVAVNERSFDFSTKSFWRGEIVSPQETNKNRFGFYLGYKDPGNGLFIGFDAQGWFWQLYKDGDGKWMSGDRIPGPVKGTPAKIKIEWDGTTATLTVNGKKAFDVDYSSIKDNLSDKFAMKASKWGSDLTDMYVLDPTATFPKYDVKGKVLDAHKKPIVGATVKVAKQKPVKTGNDGTFTLPQLNPGTYTITVEQAGYDTLTKQITVSDAILNLDDITLMQSKPVETEKIATEDMDVLVHKHFPAVSQYTMKKLDNRVMYGQTKTINGVAINGQTIKLKESDVQFSKISNDKAQYVLNVKDAEHNIDAVLTVQLRAEKNHLHFDVTKIENKSGENHPIQTIAFPNNNLVSVRQNQDGAQFTGARMSSHTEQPGDTTFAVDGKLASEYSQDFAYGFVSGGQLSAGLWSNSEHDGTVKYTIITGGSSNTRVIANAQRVDAMNSLGLTSAPWYYRRTVTDSKGRSYTVAETAMPKMAVAITGDANNDKQVDWQDGALAYRDIMNNPYKSEEVPELVAWRIAMNFGGQAQNPFLTTLDNVKKVSLHTDGLGQSVLLKGYGNEGHDSGHPDYGDIGKRIGGAKDMNTLMQEGKKFGARFGIHVNASEMYPEAKAFSEDMVRRDRTKLHYGWNWLDQGIGIDGIFDLASGSRVKRFKDLKDQVGDNMDFIYLDVWGNNTSSGNEDSWQTRKMSKMITDNGWRMTTEWGAGNEYDSTFQHWAADLTYGGKHAKGANSQVMRFLRNHQKDSWVGDFPRYGGAANAPLLGGYNMKDFEGWQGRNDYDAYIRNLYTHDVSTKFIQHFKVQRWVNSPLDNTSAKDPQTNNGNEQIELADAHGNKLVISRASNDQNSADYRKRTITLNDKVVASGAVSPGDETKKGDESYLLPWLWDVNSGKMVADKDQKLYHWNTKGGSTTWTLPKGWENLANVKIYKLTDLGKTEEKTVAVAGGKVTLQATAETPYVVYKGEAQPKQLQITWSDGTHLVDVGFNSGADSLTKHWKVEKSDGGNAAIAKSQFSNPMLKLTGTASASQTMTGLTPGKRYALYVGVDNRSNTSAGVKVTDGTTTLDQNSTDRSIAKNYVQAYAHNTNSATVGGTSYFQNMYAYFTAPASGKATVTLWHRGAGDVYFDDVRVVETAYNGLTHKNGRVTGLTNNFDHNAQGLWPFVVAGSEGVNDNRVHLSEKHAPFTQAGWDVKKMDDVLEGNWSVKVNGLTGKDSLVYQTIPQNFKFEPGRKYKVSFDYQTGSDDTYALAVGNGEFKGKRSVKLTPFKKALGTTAHHSFEITGSIKGDTWFGIYSTHVAPKIPNNVGGSARDFGGYKDFVLDNLKIEEMKETPTTKQQAQDKINAFRAKVEQAKSKMSHSAYAEYQGHLADLQAQIDANKATSKTYYRVLNLVAQLEEGLINAPDNAGSDAYDVTRKDYDVNVGSFQPLSGNEGPAEFAQDKNPGTHWHSKWSEDAVHTGKAWYEFTLKKPMTISGLRYLPREGGATANGKIKRYKIELTKQDGKKETIIADGQFVTDTIWQLASFAHPVEKVTKVRLTALETAGDGNGQFVSAAELRLTTPRDVQIPDQPVDKADLQQLVTSAKSYKEADYTPATWKVLADALKAAEGVIANTKATLYDVRLAEYNLRDAIDGLKKKGNPDPGKPTPPDDKPGDKPNPGGDKPGDQPGDKPHGGSDNGSEDTNKGQKPDKKRKKTQKMPRSHIAATGVSIALWLSAAALLALVGMLVRISKSKLRE